MKIKTVVMSLIAVCAGAPGGVGIAIADEPKNAHSLAEQFAKAHQPKAPTKTGHTAIEAGEVEGAFQNRKQEAELTSTDKMLDAIEARTKAIEDLLARSASNTWQAETIHTTPQTTPANAGNTSNPAASNTTAAAAGAADTKNIYDLPEPSYALGGSAAARSGLTDASDILTTATVLLKLKPGNKGLRRFKKTADPVLCGRRHCYMSLGFEKKAQRMARGATLGPFNTLGRRAGSCRQSVICAFRGVDIMNDGVLLQPVDLKFMRHDRRAYRSLKADSSCRVSGGRLHCANPIVAKTWTAWVVPEHIAVEAGNDALATALTEGLPSQPTPTVHVSQTKK